jgi:periplasmic divalent cation tolerance protein
MLLEQKVTSCVNIIPKINSLFWWNQIIEQNKESMLIVKTNVSRINDIVRLVKEAHSYDIPEIIALPIIGGNQDYLEWISNASVPSEPG